MTITDEQLIAAIAKDAAIDAERVLGDLDLGDFLALIRVATHTPAVPFDVEKIALEIDRAIIRWARDPNRTRMQVIASELRRQLEGGK